ncbi:replication associated protein [Chifec virus UA13_115]|nr:replication associated protein [Chifec virus UA13_115]
MSQTVVSSSVPSVSRRSKSKYYCFTSYASDKPLWCPSKMGYLIYGRETCPTTGRQHWQGYVQFKNRQYLSGAKACIPGAHFERAKGTASENKEYCIKDGEYEEFGALSTPEVSGGAFRAVVSAAKRGDLKSIENDHPGLYLRYKAVLSTLRELPVDDLDGSCGFWLCGPPRTGKDYAITSIFKGNLYTKMMNKWWDGYEGEENVLIADLDDFHAKFMGHFLKIWCDRYPFIAEVKGGSMKIRPKRIFCTSNFNLSDLFSGQILSALQARMEILSYDAGEVYVTPRPVYQPSDLFKRVLLSRNVCEKPALQSSQEVLAAPGPSRLSTPWYETTWSDEEDFQDRSKKK